MGYGIIWDNRNCKNLTEIGRVTAKIFSRGSAPRSAGAQPQTPYRKVEIGQYNTEVV